MLKTRFVPVAIDQAYQRRQKDAEGEFYRKIAGQGPRSNFNGTTQGFYIATAGGKLLLYNNNRDPAKLRRLMTRKLTEYEGLSEPLPKQATQAGRVDARYNVKPPAGGLVVRVRAKVLDGYEPTDNRWRRIFQSALSRDNLWVSQKEHRQLVQGQLPISLLRRIARYHLVDNTRGEPPMWRENQIQRLTAELDAGKIRGQVHLGTKDGKRGFQATLRGSIKSKGEKVTEFNVVALGDFWGEGRFTRGAPKGKFPLAISFTLADGTDVADAIPPQGSRGWVRGYLR